jgi:hypothetical protein
MYVLLVIDDGFGVRVIVVSVAHRFFKVTLIWKLDVLKSIIPATPVIV